MNPHIQEKLLEFRKKWQENFFYSTTPNSIVSFIDDALTSIDQQAREEERKKVEDVISWLLGENGDFPDLSQKPHYKFRTELRKKWNDITNPPNKE